MKKYIYNRDNGYGAMKFHVEIPYDKEVYLFSVQEINDKGNSKELGFYKGKILSEKKYDKDGESVELDDKKKPPQEVIDMAIKRGVPKTIIFPYEK